MKRNDNMNSMLNVVSQLSKEEQTALVEQILAMMQNSSDEKTNSCHTLVTKASSGMPDCPHCGAKAALKNITKWGRKANGAQRYRCKACGKSFVPTTGTAFAYTKKDADTWRRFIHLTITGATLATCEEECNLSHQTASDWRHKILHVFELNQEDVEMTGNIEVDEMMVPLSYKGNHVQGRFGVRRKTHEAVNDMPRKAYRRGTDNKSMSSKEKACVFCMVQDGNKGFYTAVPGVGFMTPAMLDATVAKHVNKEKSMMLADNYKITRNYFEDNGYSHTILSSNTSDNPHDHKPEIKGELHLQHVNAFHHHIRDFLKPYCGVSSKYLSHYVALFVWLKSVGAKHRRRTMDALEEVSLARVSMSDSFIATSAIRSRPAVPVCA